MKKSLMFVASVALILLAVLPAAWSQEGTPNLQTPQTWQGPTVWQGGMRTFRGAGNTIWSLGVRGEVNERTEVSLTYVGMDVAGRDPIGGEGESMSAVRASDLHTLSLEWKARISRDGARRQVALLPAIEYANRGPVGINTDTGGYAQQRRYIPSLSIPISCHGSATRWIVEPKVVWFDSSMPDSVGGITQGFGRVIALGVGVVKPIDDRDDFIADVVAVLDGDNVMDEKTNTVDKALVWSAGVRWTRGSERTTVIDLFVTNSAGPTPATSLIAAPDHSKGLGVRIEHEF